MKSMAGKVIAIVAPTRTGKSFLMERLANHYDAPFIREYEVDANDIPQEVQDGLREGNSIAGWLYFRNRHVDMQLKASESAAKNPLVFVDATWITDRAYDRFCVSDPFHLELVASIHDLDRKVLPWPDIVLMLTCDDATSEQLWRSSGKNFERNEAYFAERLLPLKREFESYMKSLAFKCPVIRIDRSGLDFNKLEDLKVVTSKVDEALKELL
jgi:deoxyadenosine/deoxycytidine kinase